MNKKITIFILILLVAIPYLPTLRYPFLLDDYHLIIRNENLSSLADLKHYFVETHQWQKGYSHFYRPMMYVSLMFNHSISGKEAWSYHLFNLIINLLNALLVFFIANNIFKSLGDKNRNYFKTALAASAIFALHPIHTEAVTNIAGRADLMMTFWILLGVCLSEKAYKGNVVAGWAVGFCALFAGLTKETGFLFMPVILLFYFFIEKNKSIKKINKIRCWIAGSIGSLFSVAMYISAQSSNGTHFKVSYLDNFCAYIPFDQRIKTAVYLFGKSIKLLFIPYPLSSDYSFAEITPQLSFLNPYSAIAIITISCGLLWSWKKPATTSKRITEFAILWFILCYVLSSNLFFTIGTVFGERLLYLASVGFCITLAWWIYQLKSRKIRLLILVPILCLFTGITMRRNIDWENSVTFYKAMKRTAPNSAKAYFSFAKLEFDRHNFNKAANQLNNSLAIFPAYAEAHSLLATVFLHEQNYSNAFVEATRAIRLNPNVPSAHYTLYKIYKRLGNKEKARKQYEFTKELMP